MTSISRDLYLRKTQFVAYEYVNITGVTGFLNEVTVRGTNKKIDLLMDLIFDLQRNFIQVGGYSIPTCQVRNTIFLKLVLLFFLRYRCIHLVGE